MANIKIDKKELLSIIKSEQELIERINLMGTPVESVTTDEIEIQILPNRSDCLSAQGFLRAFRYFAGKNKDRINYKIYPPEKGYSITIDSSLTNIRPFTACAIVKGIKFTDEKIKEIIDLQEKMHLTLGRSRKKMAIGIYPLDKISLPIKFEARTPKEISFIPLEASKEMNGLEILQQHPTGREYAHLVEGLDKFPVFVDAKGKVLSMPPIINSHETGKIDLNTKEVFIECSGSDFNLLKKSLIIIVTSLADMGGKIYSMELKYGNKREITPNLTPEKMKLSIENVNKLIGLSLTEKDIEKLLQKMGYSYNKGIVFIPAWRVDILHEVDIIEDIAIAYGYDKLAPEIPKVSTIGEESRKSKIENKVAEILMGLELIEISTYHLIKEEEKLQLSENDKVELIDSKTEYKLLRPNLIIPALRILAENKDNEYPQKIFEIGTVFSKDTKNKEETGIKESQNLIVACTPGNFTEMKQILDYLFKMLNKSYSLKEANNKYLIEGRTGEIFVENKSIGYLGEVHPQTLRNFGIKFSVALIEISLDDIANS